MDLDQIDCRQSSIFVRVINQHDQTLHFLPEFTNINSKAAFLSVFFYTVCTQQSSIALPSWQQMWFLADFRKASVLLCSLVGSTVLSILHCSLLICDVFHYVLPFALLWYCMFLCVLLKVLLWSTVCCAPSFTPFMYNCVECFSPSCTQLFSIYREENKHPNITFSTTTFLRLKFGFQLLSVQCVWHHKQKQHRLNALA